MAAVIDGAGILMVYHWPSLHLVYDYRNLRSLVPLPHSAKHFQSAETLRRLTGRTRLTGGDWCRW